MWASVAAASGFLSPGSMVVAHWLCRSKACGIFLDQGSNSCRLPWQVDSLPLSHKGSPALYLWLVLYGIEVTNRKKKKKKRIEKNSFLIPCGSMVRSAGSNNVGKLMLCPHFSDFNKYFSERRPACFNCTQSNSRSSFFCPSHVEMADNPQPFFI